MKTQADGFLALLPSLTPRELSGAADLQEQIQIRQNQLARVPRGAASR